MSTEQRQQEERLQRFAKSHQCATCKGNSSLTVRWWQGQYQCWCARCGNTERFVWWKTTTQEWKANPGAVDIATANRLEERYGGNPMTSQALTTLDEKQMLERIDNAAKGGKVRFLADLNQHDRRTLAEVSVRYGYDPLMGEVVPYEGRLYVTAPALQRKAAEHPAFEGLEDRPMTDEERKQYRYTAPHCWIAKVWKKGMRCPAVGTGTADPAKPYRNNPVEVTRPEWMARARAIRQAIKLYFPPASPFAGLAEDVGLMVDVQSGEIVQAEATPDAIEAEFSTVTSLADEAPDPDVPEPGVADEGVSFEEDTKRQRRGEIKAIYDRNKWGWDIFLGKFKDTYKADFESANLTQLDNALESIRRPRQQAAAS